MEFGKVDTPDAAEPSGLIRHKRDGRPKIFPEGGGKGEYYTRVTTFIDALHDKSTLGDWKLRQVLKGLSRRPDLLEDYQKIGDPDGIDKWKALKVAERALDAAGAGMKASAGTEVHDAIESAIWGREWTLPPDIAPDVAAFVHATKAVGMEFLDTEVFGVHDGLKAAGSADYVCKLDCFGEDVAYISDLKTGAAYYGKTAMQLAIYSRCERYNPHTHERSPLVGGVRVNVDSGLYVHVPLGQGRCTIRPLDLDVGWEHVLVAQQVREARKWQNAKANTPPVLADFSSNGESLAA